MKEFKCTHTFEDGKTANWTGTITTVRKTAGLTEAEVSGRGSTFTVIFGDYRNGHFLCIPDLDVGCPMSRWDDLFWNMERLGKLMNTVDAVTVASGIKAIMCEKTRTEKRSMER